MEKVVGTEQNLDSVLVVGNIFDNIVTQLYTESDSIYFLRSLCDYEFLYPNVRDDTMINSIRLVVEKAFFLPIAKTKLRKSIDKFFGNNSQRGFVISFLKAVEADKIADYPKYFLSITKKTNFNIPESDSFDFRFLSDVEKQDLLFRDPHVIAYVDDCRGVFEFHLKEVACKVGDKFAKSIKECLDMSNRYIEYNVGRPGIKFRSNADCEMTGVIRQILLNELF